MCQPRGVRPQPHARVMRAARRRCRSPWPARAEGRLLGLVFERDLDLGAVLDGLAVLDLDVELVDLRDAQITKGARCALDRGGRRLLPRLRTRADQLDDLVHAFSHGGLLSRPRWAYAPSA